VVYVIAARLLFDFAAVDPNPARDPNVRLPKHVHVEPTPPFAEHVLAILDELGRKWGLRRRPVEVG
jgi:hypothetical protein